MTDTMTIKEQQITITKPHLPQVEEVLTAGAVRFLTHVVEKFAHRVPELLETRQLRQKKIDAGQLPNFLSETRSIRESEWSIQGIPTDLQDRRVEITGPTDRKMVINALNANVKVFMADFEDSLAPSWEAVLNGQKLFQN